MVVAMKQKYCTAILRLMVSGKLFKYFNQLTTFINTLMIHLTESRNI